KHIDFTRHRTGRNTRWRIGEDKIDRTYTPTGELATQQATGFPAQTFSLDLGDFGDTTARPDPHLIRRDEYAYRPDGFLTTHTTTRPDTPPEHATYRLDPVGRVNAITRNHTITEAYEYDALSNITASLPPPSENADTPPAPARMEGREYHNNLLTRDGRNHYYYDPAGRLIRKVTTRISRKPDIWHYRYNAFDQLTDIYTPGGEWWQYTYDAHGRRTTKKMVIGQGTCIEERYLIFDGNRLIEQQLPESITRWQYHPDTFTPIIQESVGSEVHRRAVSAVLTDVAGRPHELVEPNYAHRQGVATADLWGGTRWVGASSPIGFHGQFIDEESGLHYNYRRLYDPVAARFITSDPLGLDPAPNPFSYPRNPMRWSDPLGLNPDYREFAHGTSLTHADNITQNGISAEAGQAASNGGAMNRGSSFF
ncbi:RHS repeat-associated core domain-containing protein, partial [Nocardia sp. NPDC058497]|uniref:RHS repeat-associated core domain-containing protein n=1 Tax=Nocardia sp. NPDC058497 TaxID=3346529 RepID=UPI003666B0AE